MTILFKARIAEGKIDFLSMIPEVVISGFELCLSFLESEWIEQWSRRLKRN